MSTQQSGGNTTPRRQRSVRGMRQEQINPSVNQRRFESYQIEESHNPSAETTLEELPLSDEAKSELETAIQESILHNPWRASGNVGERGRRSFNQTNNVSRHQMGHSQMDRTMALLGLVDSPSGQSVHKGVSKTQRAEFVGKTGVLSLLFLILIVIFAIEGVVSVEIASGVGAILAAYAIGSGKTWYKNT